MMTIPVEVLHFEGKGALLVAMFMLSDSVNRLRFQIIYI